MVPLIGGAHMNKIILGSSLFMTFSVCMIAMAYLPTFWALH